MFAEGSIKAFPIKIKKVATKGKRSWTSLIVLFGIVKIKGLSVKIIKMEARYYKIRNYK